MVPFGLAEATTVRVDNAVGRGRGSHGVRQAAFAGGVLVLATQLVGGSILLLGHDQIVALYTRDAVVAALASSLLLYAAAFQFPDGIQRSEEHTSELQSLMRTSYAVFCLKKKKQKEPTQH